MFLPETFAYAPPSGPQKTTQVEKPAEKSSYRSSTPAGTKNHLPGANANRSVPTRSLPVPSWMQ